MIDILAAALLLANNQAAPEMGRVQMLRSLHIIGYVSPMICAGADKIAIQIWNVSGDGRTNVPASDFGQLEVTVSGKTEAGETIRDPSITLDGHLNHGEDSIRCVSSAARSAGASEFTVAIDGATYRLAE